jgi:hypothetical protein
MQTHSVFDYYIVRRNLERVFSSLADLQDAMSRAPQAIFDLLILSKSQSMNMEVPGWDFPVRFGLL